MKNICVEASDSRTLSSNGSTQLKRFIDWVKLNVSRSELLLNFIKDFESTDPSHEQITKAISRSDWFTKWGYHYLLSLSSAHLIRQCHNFKDQGVQMYGNTLFQNLQDQVYRIFTSIPPPRPARRAQVVRTDMSVYVNRYGGCFGPDCRIRLGDNSLKAMKDLNGNELIYQGEKVDPVKIKYIIKTKIPDNKIPMCQIGELLITEYHPVLNNSQSDPIWEFPVIVNSV